MKCLFAIFDRKAESFGNVMTAPNGAVMVRDLTDEVRRKDANTNLQQHPEDFQLFHLCDFNEVNGSMTVLSKPRLVCELSALVAVPDC